MGIQVDSFEYNTNSAFKDTVRVFHASFLTIQNFIKIPR